jgi:RsiW-degrading membrane proteinase PrsW (M82 family)
MGFSLALFFGFVPAFFSAGIIYWLDRFEKEPIKLLVGVFLWGALVAAGGAFIVNSLLELGVYYFTASQSAADLTTGSLIAPVIEETLKGAAVLIVFWTAHNEFDSILDGIVYAAITALGFAATENAYYIYTYGYAKDGLSGLLGLAFIRNVLVGWQHPFYTAFIGIGLAKARLSRSWMAKFIYVVLGWTAAVGMHSLHNTLSYFIDGSGGLFFTTVIDWTGWLAMLIFIFYMINREKQMLVRYLGEEVQYGTLFPQQFTTAISPSKQFRARLTALAKHSYRNTTRFYQLCGEISHKKNQYQRVGDEDGNLAAIDRLRAELRQLSPWAYS